MMSLLVHPEDDDGVIVPQLHETSAWLASMVTDVFKEILRIDPEVLLRSDVSAADVEDRSRLVQELLSLYDEEKLLDLNIDLRKQYNKLVHPGLVDQLKPYIQDTKRSVVVRRVAINIAEACGLKLLQDELCKIALDNSQNYIIRKEAVCAIATIGDDLFKKKLKPLIYDENGDDYDDELKGCTLKALWPQLINTREIFAVLTLPKRDNLYGNYIHFVTRELVSNIPQNELNIALEWVTKQPRDYKSPFRDLINEIMVKGWENLDLCNVAKSFAKAVMTRQRNYDEIVERQFDNAFNDSIIHDDKKRHKLIKCLIPLISDPNKDSTYLRYSQTPILFNKDLEWFIECLIKEESEDSQKVWAYFIIRIYDYGKTDQFQIIYDTCQRNKILKKIFSPLFEAIDLKSERAQQMSGEYYEFKRKEKELSDQRKISQSDKPSPSKFIDQLLDRCESGDLDSWWQLNMVLTLHKNSIHYGNEIESDLTILPGWESADSRTKTRVIERAKQYILNYFPDYQNWLGKDVVDRPVFAGYRALILILNIDHQFIYSLDSEIWRRWAPIIVSYPTSSGIGDREHHQTLVTLAYKNAHQEVIDTLMLLIDKQDEKHNNVFVIDKVKCCWDENLSKAILDKIKEDKLKPQSIGSILGEVLDHNFVEAKEYAESIVNSGIQLKGEGKKKAIFAALALVLHTNSSDWSFLWRVIQKDNEFGRELILKIANIDSIYAKTASRLSENELADLYIWLEKEFPYSEDPKYEDAHMVSPRECVGQWRNSILNHLKTRGTQNSIREIKRVINELPDLKWLKWSLYQAQNITRQNTWVPPKPSDIMKIAKNKQNRFVQNGSQLLDILIESLKKLESKLQGETPASRDVWDKSENNYRPIDENGFSDYIKRHLEEDVSKRGIIVNREVEIRRGEGSSSGERTDIHVDAIKPDYNGESADKITVIIEVKGAWHKDLDHAMETQLVNRYMKDNQCMHGLYLVGWFNCQQWDSNDKRNKVSQKFDNKDELANQFVGQAKELSKNGLKLRAYVLNASLR